MAQVKTTAPATLSLSVPYLWALSALLIVYALASFEPVLRETGKSAIFPKDAPTFLNNRDADQGGEIFLTGRVRTFPWHYGVFHVIPAILYCLSLPLQHIDSIRLSRPAFHRANGYVLAAMGLVLSFTGMLFPIRKHLFSTNISYSHADFLHLHALRIHGVPLLKWPTFDAALFVLGPLQLVTLTFAVSAAINGKYAEHRTWAVLHTIFGHTIAMQRIGTTLSLALGWALDALLDQEQRDWLGVPTGGQAQRDAELAAFAAATWFVSGVGMIIWLGYTFKTGKAVFRQADPTTAPSDDKKSVAKAKMQ